MSGKRCEGARVTSSLRNKIPPPAGGCKEGKKAHGHPKKLILCGVDLSNFFDLILILRPQSAFWPGFEF